MEDPTACNPLCGHSHVVQAPSTWMVGDGQRSCACTGCHFGQKPVSLLGTPDLADDRHELRHRGEQRSRCHGATQLLGDDRGLDEGESDATVLLRYGERGPVETHHRVPEIRRRLPALYDRADDRQGALLFEKGAHGVTQLLLVAREFELHTNPFLPSRPATGPVKPAASVADESLRPWCYRPFRIVSWDERLGGPRRGRRSIGSCVGPAKPGRPAPLLALPQSWRQPTRATHRIGSGRLPRPSDRLPPTPRPPDQVPADAPTLSDAPLAQRQSNGLLIRRFRVQIPRGAPAQSPGESVARGALRVSELHGRRSNTDTPFDTPGCVTQRARQA